MVSCIYFKLTIPVFGLNKLMGIVHRMSMELESKFLDSLIVKAETLQRSQSVRNVNYTPYT